jgi:preprotein translocase subunit SecG
MNVTGLRIIMNIIVIVIVIIVMVITLLQVGNTDGLLRVFRYRCVVK